MQTKHFESGQDLVVRRAHRPGAGLFSCCQVSFSSRFSSAAPLRAFVPAVEVACIVILGVLTSKQARFWHDSESLWRYVLAIRERSYFKSSHAHYNLGNLLAERSELEEAIEHFRQAVEIEPEHAEAHESLARAFVLQGRREEAAQHYQEALRILKSRSQATASR